MVSGNGRQVQAVTYVVDESHDQYCELSLDDQAERIAGAVGGRGSNPEYLYNTAALLQDLNIPDPDLDWLTQQVRKLTGHA